MDWVWKTEDIDAGRAKRAAKVNLCDVVISEDGCSADVADEETGEISYSMTLNGCTCQDFCFNLKGRKPCKHILRLAMEAGIVNKDGHTEEQQRQLDIAALKEKIARAAGFYHVFHELVCTDAEYDEMKEKLNKLT